MAWSPCFCPCCSESAGFKMKILKSLIKLYKRKSGRTCCTVLEKIDLWNLWWIMQGYTGALFMKFLRDLWFSVRTNAHKIPSVVLLIATVLMHVKPCGAVFFSLSWVCESWDSNAKAMTEGASFTTNLHISPHMGQENKAWMWAAVVSLYPVCGVTKNIILHPTNSKLLMKGKEGRQHSAGFGK